MIDAQVLSDYSLTLGWVGYAVLMVWAVTCTPWVELFTDSRR
ncbi:MAG: energy-coupling factor ABC transporter permease, partial [Pseudomonas sp.]